MESWDEPEGQTVSWSSHTGIPVATPYNSTGFIPKKNLEDRVVELEDQVLDFEKRIDELEKQIFYLVNR